MECDPTVLVLRQSHHHSTTTTLHHRPKHFYRCNHPLEVFCPLYPKYVVVTEDFQDFCITSRFPSAPEVLGDRGLPRLVLERNATVDGIKCDPGRSGNDEKAARVGPGVDERIVLLEVVSG